VTDLYLLCESVPLTCWTEYDLAVNWIIK